MTTQLGAWFSEVREAPRDAWALLTGMASAFSVFALLHHEFSVEPLRVLMVHWHEWSKTFWAMIGQALSIHIPPAVAPHLTATALAWVVLFRGLSRGQLWGLVDEAVPARQAYANAVITFGVLLWLSLIPALTFFAFAKSRLPPLDVNLGSSLLLPMLGGFAMSLIFTPRSFFAVVLAAIFLFVVGQIPL